MTLEFVKEDIEKVNKLVRLNEETIFNLWEKLDNSINEVWFFIIATVVLTSIGIISVLTHLGL